MKSLADYPQGNFALLLVGDQKTGKSRIMAGFPSPLIIDFDRNLKSVANVLSDEQKREISIIDPYTDPKTGKDVEEWQVWNNMQKQLKEHALKPEIKSICLDSLTTLTEPLKAHIVKQADLANPSSAKKGEMRQQTWEPYRKLLIDLVMWMRATQKPVIWTAHQQLEYSEAGAIIGYTVAMQGQLKKNFGGLFSDVWLTDTESSMNRPPKYKLFTASRPKAVPLGSSAADIDFMFDFTNKNPKEIWHVLKEKINLQSL